MYIKVIHSLRATVLIEGATENPPDLFDYLNIGGVDYQVVERVTTLNVTEQGPFNEKVLTNVTSIFVEERGREAGSE